GLAAARGAALEVTRAALASSRGHVSLRGGTWTAVGDPMEAAIDAAARRLGGEGPGSAPVVRRFAFDPERRLASALTEDWLLLKGAPDAVRPRCAKGFSGDADEALEALTAEGLRVLAVARRPASEVPAAADARDAERALELLGLVALWDPPHSDGHEAIGA